MCSCAGVGLRTHTLHSARRGGIVVVGWIVCVEGMWTVVGVCVRVK